MVGAGPSFEDYVAMVREKQSLREQMEILEVEADELEGLVTWFSMHLPYAETNPQLEILRQEVLRKRGDKERSVSLTPVPVQVHLRVVIRYTGTSTR